MFTWPTEAVLWIKIEIRDMNCLISFDMLYIMTESSIVGKHVVLKTTKRDKTKAVSINVTNIYWCMLQIFVIKNMKESKLSPLERAIQLIHPVTLSSDEFQFI